jgi:hypothetical protein
MRRLRGLCTETAIETLLLLLGVLGRKEMDGGKIGELLGGLVELLADLPVLVL